MQDLIAIRSSLRAINPKIRFLLTVSPVPLTATAAKIHVLQATVYSKAVLRAAAGQIYNEFDDVDYFPSFELVGTPFLRQNCYRDNLREVNHHAVNLVMQTFFAEHDDQAGQNQLRQSTAAKIDEDDPEEEAICEESLLDAFVG